MRPVPILWLAAVLCAVAAALPLGAASTAAAAGAWCSGSVSWSVASHRLGKRVLVKGRVARAYYDRTARGRPTQLDLGNAFPHPGRLTIVIQGKYRKNFPARPDGMFRRGRMICVRGVVRLARGIPQIEVRRWDARRRQLR
jgi:DNA/RNA endonuclease YhcR with UshA esterase domain